MSLNSFIILLLKSNILLDGILDLYAPGNLHCVVFCTMPELHKQYTPSG